MPDWCFNNLRLRGDTAQLEDLRQNVEGPECAFDFERIDPTPAELLGRCPDPGTVALAAMCGAAEAEDPYAWRAVHWGCIRPADPESVHVDDTEEGVLAYRLSTPWSPAEGIAASLAARFPAISVELAYVLPARGFAGVVALEGCQEVSRTECSDAVQVRALVERAFGLRWGAELLGPTE